MEDIRKPIDDFFVYIAYIWLWVLGILMQGGGTRSLLAYSNPQVQFDFS